MTQERQKHYIVQLPVTQVWWICLLQHCQLRRVGAAAVAIAQRCILFIQSSDLEQLGSKTR